MKRSLLAFAVLGAFAGAANAQSSVSIYGLVDIGIAAERGGPAGSTLKLDGSGIHSGNRLGFKGSEDLGGGLSAIFTLETGYNSDTGTLGQGGAIFGRQSWVGLQGNFGAVKFGRQYTPLFLAIDSLDPIDGMTGGSGNLLPRGGVRMNNTISYATSKAGGFSGLLAYGFGEVAGETSGSRVIGGSVAYENGPLVVKLAHHNANNATATDSAKNTYLGGSYNLGVAKPIFGYQVNKGTGAVDNRDALIGVQVPFGPHTVMASYIDKDDKSAANNDADLFALAYTYALSKRTNLYTSYMRISNENSLVYRTKGGDGSGDREFNIGIRHKF